MKRVKVGPDFNQSCLQKMITLLGGWNWSQTQIRSEGKLLYSIKVISLTVFYLLCSQPCKFLLDAVFAKGMTVRQSKEELLPQLREQCGLDLTIDR